MKEESKSIEFGGKIDTKAGIAEFPALVDEKGKITVPSFIRRALNIGGRRAGVQCTIRIEESFEKFGGRR